MTSNSDLGITEIKWVCESSLSDSDIKQISLHVNVISSIDITHHDNNIKTLSVSFKDKLQSESELHQVWEDLLSAAINTRGGNLFLKCFRAGRPGYFPKLKDNRSNEAYDFEIHCPNPKCDLNQHTWTGELPSGVQDGTPRQNDSKIYLSQGWRNSQGIITVVVCQSLLTPSMSKCILEHRALLLQPSTSSLNYRKTPFWNPVWLNTIALTQYRIFP